MNNHSTRNTIRSGHFDSVQNRALLNGQLTDVTLQFWHTLYRVMWDGEWKV